jgi:hypothetical protein
MKPYLPLFEALGLTAKRLELIQVDLTPKDTTDAMDQEDARRITSRTRGFDPGFVVTNGIRCHFTHTALEEWRLAEPEGDIGPEESGLDCFVLIPTLRPEIRIKCALDALGGCLPYVDLQGWSTDGGYTPIQESSLHIMALIALRSLIPKEAF